MNYQLKRREICGEIVPLLMHELQIKPCVLTQPSRDLDAADILPAARRAVASGTEDTSNPFP